MCGGAGVDVLSEIYNTDYASYFLPLLNNSKRTVGIKTFYSFVSPCPFNLKIKLTPHYSLKW
jgi:hypothetical protein